MDDVIRDFLAEATESIEALDRSLVQLEETPNDPSLLSEIFRVMHTIKGTCGFLGLTRLASVAHVAEDVLGQFRDQVLTPSQDSVSAILEAVDVIKSLLGDLEASGREGPGDDSALISRLKSIAQGGESAAPAPKRAEEPLSTQVGGISSVDCAVEIALGRLRARPEGLRFSGAQEDALHAAIRDAVWAVLSGEAANALGKALQDMQLDAEAEFDALTACLQEAFGELGLEGAVVMTAGDALRRASISRPQAPTQASKSNDAGAGALTPQSIRVNVESLEQLMNVASELVLIRNQLLQTLKVQPESPFAAPLQRLNHVTSELQESVMTTRMQPISAAWAKLPRLARDLAVELNKRIEVVTEGAETELDRQVLEMIKDPLTHMIRNAADHGLEPPGERAKAGKPEVGRITLAARHEGNHIVIEVSDDGRGLRPAKLRAKALARGLITPAEAENLSDAKIQQLIFHPGFSTAEAITGVSGRGVGMDVVRTNIEKIGGTVELASVEGSGTRFTIRIPLTLTIVSALIIDCCGERFAMPQSAVVELVGVGGGSGRAIEEINGTPVLRLRDRLLPLISLQELMQLPPRRLDDERSILVTRLGAFSYGIIVDHVFDTEEIVVKPAASILRGIPYYSGATILGDGAVIMILDPKGIANRLGAIDMGQNDNSSRDAGDGQERVQLLVARTGGQAPIATPLQLVSRIEHVSPDAIEYADDKPVLQYRGGLMPLIRTGAASMTAQETTPIIVFDNEEKSLGLVVDEIVDIVEAPLIRQFDADRPGVLGSIVVADRVTDLIDLAYYWRLAAAPARKQQPQQTKRALIVDPSAFHRNLVAPLLRMAGFQLHVAEDVSAVAALMEAHGPFDIVLTDVAMNERASLNGISAPVIGLYDDALNVRQRDTEGFTRIACRFDRDALLQSLAEITNKDAA